MTGLHRLDDRLLLAFNGFARHTTWLHGVVLGYATYGLALFVALLLAGLWRHRAGSNRVLAAAGWAVLAPVIAVGLNQPLGSAVAEARPSTTHPGLLVLASRSSDFSGPLTVVTGWLRRQAGLRRAFPGPQPTACQDAQRTTVAA
jgi:hypothetical protein